jgi:hypothetical protein
VAEAPEAPGAAALSSAALLAASLAASASATASTASARRLARRVLVLLGLQRPGDVPRKGGKDAELNVELGRVEERRERLAVDDTLLAEEAPDLVDDAHELARRELERVAFVVPGGLERAEHAQERGRGEALLEVGEGRLGGGDGRRVHAGDLVDELLVREVGGDGVAAHDSGHRVLGVAKTEHEVAIVGPLEQRLARGRRARGQRRGRDDAAPGNLGGREHAAEEAEQVGEARRVEGGRPRVRAADVDDCAVDGRGDVGEEELLLLEELDERLEHLEERAVDNEREEEVGVDQAVVEVERLLPVRGVRVVVGELALVVDVREERGQLLLHARGAGHDREPARRRDGEEVERLGEAQQGERRLHALKPVEALRRASLHVRVKFGERVLEDHKGVDDLAQPLGDERDRAARARGGLRGDAVALDA